MGSAHCFATQCSRFRTAGQQPHSSGAMRAWRALRPDRPLPDQAAQQQQALAGQRVRLTTTTQHPRNLTTAQCRAYRVELPGVSQALKSVDEDELAAPTAHAEDYWLPPGELSEINRIGGTGDHDVFRCFGCTRAECQARPLPRGHEGAPACPALRLLAVWGAGSS